MGKQVAIIGAGISGLLACKIQSPKDYYQFSDFPWPSSVTEGFPTQNQGHRLRMRCKLGVSGVATESLSTEPLSSEGKWKVVAEDKHSLSTEIHLVDFVILCLGRFSDVPNIPDFHPNKGPEAFHGEVIHSMNYADMDYVSAANLVKGKQVTVVGFQKFAMDIAMECSNANGVELPCRVIYKTEHWNLPDYLPWGLPLAYLYFSRFSELLVHKPGEDLLLGLGTVRFEPVSGKKWNLIR
ncbi:hypothetical protein L3X38_044403 [Prunus dulcis]|uniref:Flavin-containing monooxygenase n=1 Tax=Prunus dulcis TaxID=3755 RepID=A0AAD4V0Q4_PRUDU|nr:hypothetical protein L3X38_044403 [Prunus dulcis]